MERERLEPGPHHPITIQPTEHRVVVWVGEQQVAASTRALTLREASYPSVQYVPLEDVDTALLRPTETTTWCPFKGDASYWTIAPGAGGEELVDAVWGYAEPFPAVAGIAGHVAFYPDRVDVQLQVVDPLR